MTALRVTVFILFFSVHRLSAIDPVVNSTMTPDRNYSITSFPRLPPNFQTVAKNLMAKCLMKGHSVPMRMHEALNSSQMESKPVAMLQELLSMLSQSSLVHPPPSASILPINTTESPYDMDWNMTERLQNISSIPDMIALIKKNCSHVPRCIMHAFLAPFCWTALVANASEMDPHDFRMLLWGANPFIRNMPPFELALPTHLPPQRMADMANTFSEVYSSLIPKHRVQVHQWIMDQIRPNGLNCGRNPPNSEGHLGMGQGQGQGQGPPSCPKNWLNATSMELLGPFLRHLLASDIPHISGVEVCKFFWKPKFSISFNGMVHRESGRKWMQMVKKCCKGKAELHQQLGRIGSLLCYFDDPKSLNSSQCAALLPQLTECDGSQSVQLKKQLLIKSALEGNRPPHPAYLQFVGDAAKVLPLSLLKMYSDSDINDHLPDVSKGEWSRAQATVLARAVLKKVRTMSGKVLKSLGSLARGVSSALLRNSNLTEQLGTEELDALCPQLSPLQRAALLEALCRDMNATQLLDRMPDSLLPRVSSFILEQANLSSLDQVKDKNWTRSQSVCLVKRILGKGKLRPKDIRKMNSALQGVPCSMIDSTNQSDVLEMSQALTQGDVHWLSKTQMVCAAKKLLDSLENKRKGYFSNITDAELNAIPTQLLINMPVKVIMGLPVSVCSCFLDKTSQANISILPLSSPIRDALTDKALDCLSPQGKASDRISSASNLSSEDINRLGLLVCELRPSHLSSLDADARNSTLEALAKCHQINPNRGPAIIAMLREQRGEPSNWSSSTMRSFARLLLLNDTEISLLPYKPWLQEVLLDVLDSLPSGPSENVPEEFRIRHSLSAVHKKLFYLITYPAQPSLVDRRKRAAVCGELLTLDLITTLGDRNVEWNPDELSCIPSEVFKDAAEILGRITNYSPEQRDALKRKVKEVWGEPRSLSESKVMEMGCICKCFTPEELKELNITSVDTLEMLADCGWTEQQSKGLWQGYANRTGLSTETLGPLDLVGLGQILCGLSQEELQNLSTDAVRNVVGDVGRVNCPLSKMERLKDKAVVIFGKPENWTEASVGEMRNIIAGLSAAELWSLKKTVMAYIQSSAIPLIDPTRFAALNCSHLEALGPDNAAMVTTAQKAKLSKDQQDALARALGVSTSETEADPQNTPAPLPPSGNGVSRVGIVGTVVFLQQFLLLTLWYAM